MKNKHKEIYIDAEWFLNGKFFLLGYAYTSKKFSSLHGKNLTKAKFLNLLHPKIKIYFYGPDIGIIEKHFNIDIRNKYICINLIRVFKNTFSTSSYRLADIEHVFGLNRKRVEYKKSIFDIYGDWLNPVVRKRVIQYNKEDVINLALLKKIVFKHYNLKIKTVEMLYRLE